MTACGVCPYALGQNRSVDPPQVTETTVFDDLTEFAASGLSATAAQAERPRHGRGRIAKRGVT